MLRKTLPVLACLLAIAASPLCAQEADDCATCHEELVAEMHGNVHLRVEAFEVGGGSVGCAGCHANAKAHAEAGDPSLLATFENNEDWNETCLACHAKKGKAEFKASTHGLEGLACLDCHGAHEEKVALDSCKTCHADAVMQFQLPSHHPIRESGMSCNSCHDTHAATEAQLNTKRRVNDLCTSCHPSQEGPFVFEHAPVQEDCRMCHTPHGSIVNNLLTANEPALCLQCHEFHFHAGYKATDDPVEVGGVDRESPWGAVGFNKGFTTKCTQCHSKIHGSDLPSQSTPGQGSALTR